MSTDHFFHDARLVMVGPGHQLRELSFDRLGQKPSIGGIEMKWLGPVKLGAMESLTTEAEHYVRRHGYPPDTFGIIGLGQDKLIAIVPRNRPDGDNEVKRLRKLMGLY